ncbi:MAG: hypothetical protein GY841_14815 [FCB group bacterium]|nr:hypothetical protein [FCB group bacterium]
MFYDLHIKISLPRLVTISVALIMVFSAIPNQSLAYNCGDVNNDCCPSIGDAVYLINFVFKEGPQPIPLSSGDVNCDGRINVGDAVYMINFIFKSGDWPCCAATEVSVDFGECKIFRGADDATPDQECFQYQYDGEETLQITHINAGYNCCPDGIDAVITILNDSITIDESEYLEGEGCDCLCQYDFDYLIESVEPGTYTIVFTSPYVQPDEDPLSVILDLTANPTGEFCVARHYYPWEYPGEPSGEVIGHTGCKEFSSRTTQSVIADSLDCIEFSYDGQSVLSLKHINAGMNCCIFEAVADIDITDQIITITESEVFDSLGPCYCLCLFDIDMEINNLQPDTYTVIINELNLLGEDERLEFVIDLTLSPSSGSYCVKRFHYPWRPLPSATGQMTGFTDCKGEQVQMSTGADSITSDQGCVVIDYDGYATLTIDHINAGFNCCPDTIGADITFEGNIITITEWESTDLTGGCDCLCLYDLSFRIDDLTSGEYTIRIVEPYLSTGDDPLELTVDLRQNQSGQYCLTRTGYPWGL